MFSIEKKGGQAHIKVPKEKSIQFSLLFPKFEGRKRLMPDSVFSIEPTGSNVRLIVAKFPEMEELLSQSAANEQEAMEIAPRPDFNFRVEPLDWQNDFYAKTNGKSVFALFADPGAGKTKAAIDKAFMRYAAGEIDGVIIIANKGVHSQWVKDALPEHAPPDMPWSAFCHDYQPKTPWKQGALNFMSINFDGAKGAKAQDIIRKFISFASRLMIIIDESQNIKNKSSGRWSACYEIRRKCHYAMIMSGTPIAKNLVDYWAQYFILDEDIIGDRYMSSFRSKYCVLGGYDNKQIVGYQNEVQLFRLTEPFTYRVSKADMKMPPKRFKQIAFDMGPRQRKAFDDLKNMFVSDLQNPSSQTVNNAGVALTRMQQITSGYLPQEDGTVTYFENPRLTEALPLALEGVDGKVILWARFHHDIEMLIEQLGGAAVHYYGKTKDKERELNKERFINDPSIRFMISSASAGGVGIDGYQKVCDTAIYYTNSFNSIHRWQSEDRINRKGMVFGSSLYIDLVCRSGIDKKLLRNLRDKKQLSDLMLDDLREFFK
jgi:hypothetical protein